jgi:hypothetical protein
MKAINKYLFSPLNITNKTSLFNKVTFRNFSDWQSNGVVGGATSRQTREHFISPNRWTLFNSSGNKTVKAKLENVDKNKDFPSNSSRLNFLKGKK